MKTIGIGLAWLLMTSSVLAQHEAASESSHAPHGPHHLSILIGDTHVSDEGDNFTLGVDYEYRLSPLLGVGAVVEYAFGDLEATTVLAVADIHIKNGLIMQVGPGVENRHDHNVFVARVGVLYEFEMGNLTLSPQLHWDYHNGEANAVVAGVALGFAF